MRKLDRLVSVENFRQMARRRLPKSVFEFVDGGSGDELTLAANRADFDRMRLVPRMLTDVANPDLSTRLWNEVYATPLVISPMGSCMLIWPEADITIAKAAAARGIPYTLSTMSTTSIERMAKAVEGPLWFQLYVFKDYDFNRSLLKRATACGYETLVVTVDLKAAGKREKDLRNGISIPLRPTARQIFEGAIRPGWSRRFIKTGLPEFENVKGFDGADHAGLTIAARAARSLDTSMSLDDFRRLRDWWKGRVLVKGVLDPLEARNLVEAGADGIWISNHGGRQLDSAISSIGAAPAIREAVRADVPLLLDSGVRRGLDAIKAKAAGIDAVAIGRAAAYSVAAGQPGVERMLDLLLDEIRNGMQLAGIPKFTDIKADLLSFN